MEVDFRGKCAEPKKTHEYYPWGPLKGAGSLGTQRQKASVGVPVPCIVIDSTLRATSSLPHPHIQDRAWTCTGKLVVREDYG